MEIVSLDKIKEASVKKGHMPIEHLNLKISDKEIEAYRHAVYAHYNLAQAIYSADLATVRDNLQEIKNKIDSLRRSWKTFLQDWANIRRYHQMVFSHNDKATLIAIKVLHTTQILRVLEDPISLRESVKS